MAIVCNDTVVPTEYFMFPRQNQGFSIPQYLATTEAAEAVRPPPSVKSIEERRAEFSPEQLAALDELRALVVEQEWYEPDHHNDWMLIRYSLARNFNVKKSFAMLEKSALWNKETGSRTWTCNTCIENPNLHLMQFVGWDFQCRPILYSSMRWGTDRSDPQRSLQHSVMAFNHAVSLMPEGVEQWIHMTDFETYSHLKDSNPKMGTTVISALQDHFPERLGMMILIDAPSMFSVLWALFSPFIDARTKEKVRFMYTKSKPNIRDEFPKLFPDHVCQYLIPSFERNKTAEVAPEVVRARSTQ
ncbi:Hypothetical protein, putative [Bodo saltans]|uniref:CRAL-TRIO domain-containing protein n=1 Tax=Bodo saltans TaxID=75058 RepID=A0A0S4IKI1_BODSA|nr:Hypothetical protein, putative [Bodo saltans]|eukprot:CUE65711.1 Hypothetical protein, putative [Bodo saltans]